MNSVLALVLFSLMFALLSGPVLKAGFWLEDDYEIIRFASAAGLHPQAEPPVNLGEIIRRDASWGRIRPLYWGIHIGLMKVLGTDAEAWHLVRMWVGVATTWLLYSAFCTIGLGLVSSVLAAFLAVLPGASIWIRLGPAEVPGMFFLAVGIWALTKAVWRPERSMWDVLLVISIALSALSKESFILSIPAIGYARLFLWKWRWEQSLSSAFRSNLPTLLAFSAVFMTLLATVAVIAKRAGSDSYGGAALVIPNLAAPLVVSLIGAVLHAGAWFFPVILVLGMVFKTRVGGEKSACGQSVALITGFFLLWVIPEVVVYASRNGPWYHYAVPMTIGTAVVDGWALTWLWRKSARRLFILGTIWLVVWSGMFLIEDLRLFSFFYRAQARALNRALQSVADNVPPGKALVIVDDPTKSVEPSIALIYFVGYYGRSDVPIYLLPVPAQYSHLEFNQAAAAWLTSSVYFANRADATVLAPADVGAVIFLVPPDRVSDRQALWLASASWNKSEFAEAWLKIYADPYGKPFRLGFWWSRVVYPVWVRVHS